MDTQAATIKETVREHYGQFASTLLNAESSADCCAPSGCCSSDSACCSSQSSLYPLDMVDQLPETAVSSSRGCGNPHARAALQPGQVVLDLGSGGGLDVFLAAARVGPTGFVYGVDMTDSMLELARRNAAQAGISNVAFLKGDIEALPLEDAQVDVILSNCVINLAPDKAATLSEAFRVLRPGGRLAISDIVIDGTLADLPLPEAAIRAALDWAGCIAGAMTRDEYQAQLAAAGFREIEIQVEHRYSLETLLPELPAALAQLDQSILQQLVARFTSSLVTAQRPQSA